MANNVRQISQVFGANEHEHTSIRGVRMFATLFADLATDRSSECPLPGAEPTPSLRPRSSAYDPGCVKTRTTVIEAQQKSLAYRLGESFMRERHSRRINLAPEYLAECFSRSQDPKQTSILRDINGTSSNFLACPDMGTLLAKRGRKSVTSLDFR